MVYSLGSGGSRVQGLGSRGLGATLTWHRPWKCTGLRPLPSRTRWRAAPAKTHRLSTPSGPRGNWATLHVARHSRQRSRAICAALHGAARCRGSYSRFSDQRRHQTVHN
eukprot:3941374-Rhodomonas_salina.1